MHGGVADILGKDVPSYTFLCDGTVLSNNFLFDGTIPSNNLLNTKVPFGTGSVLRCKLYIKLI